MDRIVAMVQHLKTCTADQTTNLPSKEDIEHLIDCAIATFLREETLVEVEPSVIICGDVHGQFVDLMRIFDIGGWPDGKTQYLFLGDYVDSGSQSVETICLLLAFKVLYSTRFFLLRGNHESGVINRVFGFYENVMQHFNEPSLWNSFNYVFNCMPIAGLVSKRIFCMHGGLSPELESFDQIRRLKRPISVPDSGLVADLLWADPDRTVEDFNRSARGISCVFGADVVIDYCAKLDI